ncbi:NAD(P)-dependent oxidoreductase [Ideonella sp. DXS22W]|uniref:NAD(P)-dependent oxidoreductase n=1 Tax=Pseudaquabacterium inlustre TaxID=2984192 RepID=A0ABU9CDY5_9BURK
MNTPDSPLHRPRILSTWPVHDDVVQRLRALGDLDMHTGPEPLPADELARRIAAADALLGFMTDRVDAALLHQAPRLRVVAGALKGCDGYDVDACTAAGVWLTIVPDLLTEPTAELALGLAIGLGRHLREGDAQVRSGAFAGWRPTLYGHGLHGRTVAIVGMGRLGRAIAERLRGFGCRLLGVDAAAIPGAWHQGVTPMDLAGALAQADWVMLALPLTSGTRHLIDATALAAARAGALWVNVGRGSVVDEAAMADALASGQVGGYAADVFAFEDLALPQRPATIHPALRGHPATLFTPHLGSAVTEVRRAIEHRAVDNLAAALAGQVPPDAVNRPD